ncbi:hypothetical protein ACFL27_03000 [candidate division CSSED10-310 bacterium]|uniref:Uncharacterized protein n=1 Tax=candidate division CSSED10-310 bacterium TaxID=2855610 RepID=A0ABV6YSH7_UNCC1
MTSRINQLPASKLILPFIRPLVSIFTMYNCLGEHRWDEMPPEAIRDELQANTNFLDTVVDRFQEKVGDQSESYASFKKAISELEGYQEPPSQTYLKLNNLSSSLLGFVDGQKREMSSLYLKMKSDCRDLYHDLVKPLNVVLFHGIEDEMVASSISKTLAEGCYYQVTDLPAQPSQIHIDKVVQADIRAMYSTNPATISTMLSQKAKYGLDILLSKLGKKTENVDATLSKTLYLVQKRDLVVIYPPFPAIRLLHKFEYSRYQRLLEQFGLKKEEEKRVAPKGEFHFRRVPLQVPQRKPAHSSNSNR